MACVNSHFAEVTENDILRMQDVTVLSDTRKATKLGIKVLRDKQCFNTQFSHMSSVFCPDCQACWCLSPWKTVLPPSISKFHPSQFNFHWAKHLHSRKFKCRYLFKMIVISNTPTASTWHDFWRKLHKLFFQFLFQVTATSFTELLQGINIFNSNFVQWALTDIVKSSKLI